MKALTIFNPNFTFYLLYIQDITVINTDKIQGVSHATIMLESNTIYNLMTTEVYQSFSAYLYTTFQRIRNTRHSKGVNIGYTGKSRNKTFING